MKLTRAELYLMVSLMAISLFGVLGPQITQTASYHQFVDTRPWFGIPRAMDVLTNSLFMAFGVWGLLVSNRIASIADACTQIILTRLFCVGLILTALGSGFYHLDPTDAGLSLTAWVWWSHLQACCPWRLLIVLVPEQDK